MNVLPNLPIGIQDFRSLREGGYLYVDKTQLIHRLVTTGRHYFLARPRRFGKSLLVSTLQMLFEGHESLFRGLWIHDHWDWQQTWPVVHLSLDARAVREIPFPEAAVSMVTEVAAAHGLRLEARTPGNALSELVKKMHQHYQKPVVVLIDEYDKPLLEYLDAPEEMLKQRDYLRSFYGVLKNLDPYLKLVFVTGITRFAKAGVYSEFNNPLDISYSRDFAALTGYTQAELDTCFAPFENRLLETSGSPDRETLKARIKAWYNGYNFGSKEKLYNPFSVLNLMNSGEFRNYWYNTGVPYMLTSRLQQAGLADLDGLEVDPLTLDGVDLNNLPVLAQVYQAGFLTILRWDSPDEMVTVGYPNREVRESMLKMLIPAFAGGDVTEAYHPPA